MKVQSLIHFMWQTVVIGEIAKYSVSLMNFFFAGEAQIGYIWIHSPVCKFRNT